MLKKNKLRYEKICVSLQIEIYNIEINKKK